MKIYVFICVVFLFGTLSATQPPREILNQIISGTIVYSKDFNDSLGIHCLIMIKALPLKKAQEESLDVISLFVYQFSEINGTWQKEWIIKDWVECPGLDVDADFITDFTSFTDLDSNGILETTVSYFLICIGDISPKNVKTIMREGKIKYAVRGESTVLIGNNEKYGGSFTTDSSLQKLPVFKEFLEDTWNKAARSVSVNY